VTVARAEETSNRNCLGFRFHHPAVTASSARSRIGAESKNVQRLWTALFLADGVGLICAGGGDGTGCLFSSVPRLPPRRS
jgi:hypothetical protein